MSNARNLSKAESRFINADGDSFSGYVTSSSGIEVNGAAGLVARDSNSQLWIGTSGGNTYIESGNSDFTGSAPLLMTGHNSNWGSNLNMHFSQVYAESVLQVGDYAKLPREQFSMITGSVPANGSWQQILSGLNAHHTYMISVDVSESSYHDTGILLVAGSYASGNVWNFRGGGEGYSNAVISATITGSTYDWGVAIRVASGHPTATIFYKIKEYYV